MPMRSLRVPRFLPLVLVGLLLAAVLARACMTGEFNSVHFHSGAPDFGIPPARAELRWRGDYDDRPLSDNDRVINGYDRRWVELTYEGFEKQAVAQRDARLLLLMAARHAEKRGQWGKALRLYAQVGRKYGWDGNSRDRAEVLGRVAAMKLPLPPAFASALRLYLDGMGHDDAERRTEALAAFEQVYRDRAAGFLREHALYQQASLAKEYFDYPRAIALYRRFLREFPRSPKREAALIMMARCAILPATPAGRDLPAGKQALAQLLKEFPHTRFRGVLRGLRARSAFLEGRWTQALQDYFAVGDLESVEIVRKAMLPNAQGDVRVRLLEGYLRRLARAKNFFTYERAVMDIERTLKAFSPADARAFKRHLFRRDDLIAPYLYYRLYHSNSKPADLARLAKLADAITARRSSALLPPLVRVRLAEVYYRRGQYDLALHWAERAVYPRPWDRALYVRGATLHKLKRYRAAIADFAALLRRFPKSPLRRGAREELALLYEATGDYGSALEQYFALDYRMDIAYLLDIRMTPRQIEDFLRSRAGQSRRILTTEDWHTDPPRTYRCTQRDLLLYSLGIRYLRDEKWRQAAYWLRLVPYKTYVAFSAGRKYREYNADTPSPEPLTAVRDLSRLERDVAAAKSDNARAAALYRYATYYSTHGTLLLYNPALWNFQRAYGFNFWWNPDPLSREDKALVRDYMYRHEVYARSRQICLEIARRYPHSPTVPRALYRAGAASRRLAEFNLWWDEENKRHSFWKESIRLMKQVADRYPRHPLAKHARKYARVFHE